MTSSSTRSKVSSPSSRRACSPLDARVGSKSSAARMSTRQLESGALAAGWRSRRAEEERQQESCEAQRPRAKWAGTVRHHRAILSERACHPIRARVEALECGELRPADSAREAPAGQGWGARRASRGIEDRCPSRCRGVWVESERRGRGSTFCFSLPTKTVRWGATPASAKGHGNHHLSHVVSGDEVSKRSTSLLRSFQGVVAGLGPRFDTCIPGRV